MIRTIGVMSNDFPLFSPVFVWTVCTPSGIVPGRNAIRTNAECAVVLDRTFACVPGHHNDYPRGYLNLCGKDLHALQWLLSAHVYPCVHRQSISMLSCSGQEPADRRSSDQGIRQTPERNNGGTPWSHRCEGQHITILIPGGPDASCASWWRCCSHCHCLAPPRLLNRSPPMGRH